MPRVPQVTKCPSAWGAFRVSEVLGCPSAQVSEVSKCLEYHSNARVPKCPWSAPGKTLECPWSALWVHNFPLSRLWAKKSCNITSDGFVNIFRLFKNFLEHIFYMTLLFSLYLEMGCVNFTTCCWSDVIIQRCFKTFL